MPPRSWVLAEELSWPPLAAELVARGRGRAAGLVEETIVFGDHRTQHVLLIRSERIEPETPLVFFVHGGSWRHGSPERFRAIGRFFARAGYAAALGGYRLLPEHTFPAQLDDVLAGLGAALKHSRGLGIPGGRVLIAGQSAGAHLAALAAFDRETRAASGIGDLSLAGLLAVSGPLDFGVLCPTRDACPLIEALMGGRDGWEAADPARFADGSSRTPVLCLHGSRDPLVPSAASASFVARANGADGDHAQFVADPEAHHSDMTALFFGRSPLTPVMLDWMAEVTRVA
jgi:acetyl esterase/lipase